MSSLFLVTTLKVTLILPGIDRHSVKRGRSLAEVKRTIIATVITAANGCIRREA
ncbi:hypothetical protein KI809_05325 [Geobacter pelophilus]|uniref:Transposase n=1 Tax=Geoanaerobacter pelophilus TaxID=60036 RepID=A0AAW4KZC2_9BACT|nr:hypothetical protein [Geoanaerobacter pelophilus]MBT0663719.1 hypothetical protein [Geoanaerobacter pelophilus]